MTEEPWFMQRGAARRAQRPEDACAHGVPHGEDCERCDRESDATPERDEDHRRLREAGE